MDTDKVFIKDLDGKDFLIPDYQRGYRWTGYEVRELLDDIWEFADATDNNMNYCLQTLMVIEDNSNGIYEVVDGQQRLTTIFIILSIAKRYDLCKSVPYYIEYQTRKYSKTFLENISDINKYRGEINKESIDYYHITSAYQAIEAWLNKKAKEDPLNADKKSNTLSKLISTILDRVFFIYYPVPNSNEVKELFRKINLGKIPLSNAELIKAIIFNQDNYGANAEVKQQELSLEWNRLERELENESFWWFIIKDEKESSRYVTRLDYLFELVLLRRGRKVGGNDSDSKEQKQYITFHLYYAEYKKCKGQKEKNEYIETLWRDTNEIFEKLQEWYNNLNLYHIIGYLISDGVPVKDLIDGAGDKSRSEIVQDFADKIKNRKPVNEIIIDNNGDIEVDVTNVIYVTGAQPNLRLLFLFFNIATLITKNNKQYRFPFDLFKKEKWDIEHIHATADETGEPDDALENLTLLDLHTNREFKDDTFEKKREHVINKDKEGRFIPICTKNVYLKEYTKDITKTPMNTWGDNDKNDYIAAIKEIITEFFEGHFEYGEFIKQNERKK